MIGPSSSHTAGAVRIGQMTRKLLNDRPVKGEILLHGSFATTGKGHGTDKALVAGILGFSTDQSMTAMEKHLQLCAKRLIPIVRDVCLLVDWLEMKVEN